MKHLTNLSLCTRSGIFGKGFFSVKHYFHREQELILGGVSRVKNVWKEGFLRKVSVHTYSKDKINRKSSATER